MAINWPVFLTQHNINYVTSGPNISRDGIGINCPNCNDPSEHLDISLQDRGWYCRRCNFGGKSPVRLIQRLLKCSYQEAADFAGIRTPTINVSDHTFGEYINNMMKGADMLDQNVEIIYPKLMPEMRHCITLSFNKTPGGLQYLIHQRNYNTTDALRLSRLYNLHYTPTGPFKYRLIIPVYDEHENLLTWTGRAITHSNLRYKDLTADADKAKNQGVPKAVCPIKHTLLNLNQFAGHKFKALYIVEGPLDALRIDYFMRDRGIRATCTFGNLLSDEQAILLQRLTDSFRHMYHTFDPDSEMNMPKIASKLAHLNIQSKRYPNNKDAAEMSPAEIKEWVG